jgi:hypothetical protein
MVIKEYDVVKVIEDVIVENDEGNLLIKSGEIGVVVETYPEKNQFLVEFTELNLENICYLIEKENLEIVE